MWEDRFMLGTSSCYRWFATVVAAGAVLLVMAACTSPSSVRSPSASEMPSHVTSGSDAPSSHRTVRLTCADAGSGSAPTGDGDGVTDRITLEGIAGNVEGSRPADVGLNVPTGDTLYFIKAPAWLKAGAAATIELSPASGGYLAWVPARIWTGGGGAVVDLTPWMASKLVLDGCPDRDVTYFGGLLSTDRNICLKLQVADAFGKFRQIPVGSAAHC